MKLYILYGGSGKFIAYSHQDLADEHIVCDGRFKSVSFRNGAEMDNLFKRVVLSRLSKPLMGISLGGGHLHEIEITPPEGEFDEVFKKRLRQIRDRLNKLPISFEDLVLLNEIGQKLNI